MIHHEFPRKRQRDIFFQAVKRLAWRTKRKVTYQDLVIFAAYGTSEADVSVDPPMLRYRHAVHEAGHALLVHLDSREKLPPEYSSVIKRGNTLGIVVRRYEDHERISNDLSYCDIVHKIRVLLAGRAAEYLLLGANEISVYRHSCWIQFSRLPRKAIPLRIPACRKLIQTIFEPTISVGFRNATQKSRVS